MSQALSSQTSHVLVGDGVQAELPEEGLERFRRAGLLHLPDGLGEGVGPAPGAYPDGPGVVFVGEADQEFAAGGVVPFADDADAGAGAAHHRAAPQVAGAGPVPERLGALLLLGAPEPGLPGPLHEVVDIDLISVDDAVQVFRPFLRVRVAVPADGGDEGFDLEAVGIGEQADGRLVVVRLHLGRADVGEHDEAGLERGGGRRLASGRKGRRGRQEKAETGKLIHGD